MSVARALGSQGALFPIEGELRHQTNFVSNMQLPVHRWFRYSAGFSAAWVEQVLREEGDPSTMTVLDPFAGSGTTLLGAQFVGAASVGWDSHPFVARVAKAKLSWGVDPVAFRSTAEGLLDSFRPVSPPESTPSLLTKCYTPTVLADLLGLRDAVFATDSDDAISSLVWLAFVSIVRRVSFVGTAHWQYVLPNKRKGKTTGVIEAFQDQVEMMAIDMEWRQLECAKPPTAEYLERDARTDGNLDPGWASHVICSPPYANNYDYADATRLEQTVLGEVSSWGDLKHLRNKLIRSCSQHMVKYDPEEAFADPLLAPIREELEKVYAQLDVVRLEHGGKKAYHSMVLAYFHDLAHVWRNLRAACAPEAHVCFVIGDSAPYGVYVPVERWLGEIALSVGFSSWEFEKVRDRNIKWKNRKHRVPLHEGRLWVRG